MAFNPERLSLIVQPVGDGGIRFFGYQTDDAEGTLVAADYFARGRDSGMRASDLIFISPKDGATDPYILVIDSVDDEGNATAVLGDSLALGGYATEPEATGGVVSNKTMSPLRAKQLVDYERTQDRSFTGVQTFYSTSEAATSARVEAENTGLNPGPLLDLLRTSASPAANDYIGGVRFRGIDSAAAEVTYGNVRAQILDPTTTATDSLIEITTAIAGAQVTVAKFYNGMIVGAPTGSYQGTGTVNATGYYLNGTALSSTLFGVAVGTASGNLKALNADGGFTIETTEATQTHPINSYFGGAFGKAAHVLNSVDTDNPYTESRTTLAVSRTVKGSGASNPYTDHAIWAVAAKDDLQGTTDGEVDALRVTTFQNQIGDSGGAIFGTYKKVGPGDITEGGAMATESTIRRFTTNLVTLDHHMNALTCFSPNPGGVWASRKPIGFYAENYVGASLASFVGITDNAGVGGATQDYLIAGYRMRDPATRYFSVSTLGYITSIWIDAGASGGSWKRFKDSASPAANDVLWNDYWTGRNDAAEEINFARIYGSIVTVTDGAEAGQLVIRTMVGGAETDQMVIRNGLSIGAPTGGPLGTGSVNIASFLAVNGTTVIGGDGAVRFTVTATSAQLTDITHAINTTNKAVGKIVWDSTGNRAVRANGATAGAVWYVLDGSATVTPV